MAVALIMAGGESKRMRDGGAAKHKALVPVCGVPMIERNLRYVMAAGFRDVVAAVSAREEELLGYVQGAAQDIAREMGGTCAPFVELSPLGTAGAVGQIDFPDDLLVVNVDNLTSLDLAALMDEHRRSGADLTIAAHRHPLPLDFGELVVDGGRVLEYREKPVRYPLVSSGVYGVSRKAASSIACGERLGVPEFYARVQTGGMNVRAFEHSAAWIDVNDLDALRKAEAMFAV
jgi:NDP-sugar pyrophosphorylase family protein